MPLAPVVISIWPRIFHGTGWHIVHSQTGTFISKRHTSTHPFVIWMREKVFLAHPRFCRIFPCAFTSLEHMYCISIRRADTHSLVTGDMPLTVLVDTKFWDVIKYCTVVPALVQDNSVAPPLPAGPDALVLWPVLRSSDPWLNHTRGHAAGVETPPDPSRVWVWLPFTCSHPWGLQPRKDPFSSL